MANEVSDNAEEGLQNSRVDRVWLFEVPLPDGTTERVTNYTDSIEFPAGSGNTYEPTVLEVPTFKQTDDQEIPKMEVKVGNLDKRLQTEIRNNDGLVGTVVTVKLIQPDYNESGDELINQEFEIKSSSYNQRVAIFQLSSFLDKLNVRMTRKVTRELFPHIPRTRTIIR